MCGIVGFTNRKKQAAPILLEGLSKLEYRGYDSAGLAVRDGDQDPVVVRAKGRLRILAEKTNDGKAIVVPRHAINDDYNLYCVGALLITETIKYCINETAIRNLDLSRGDEKYKYTLGGQSHYNHSYRIICT